MRKMDHGFHHYGCFVKRNNRGKGWIVYCGKYGRYRYKTLTEARDSCLEWSIDHEMADEICRIDHEMADEICRIEDERILRELRFLALEEVEGEYEEKIRRS